jgi:lipopolysaccharide exporter
VNQVHNAMTRGAVWLTALKLSERGLGLINTIILARLLTPQDFGVVAMCMVVVAALEAFTSFGFDVVLIQRQDANKEQYDTAFTLNAIFGLAIGTILIASGGLISWFYSDPRLTPVMYVVGANFFVRSLENIAIVDFRKHFQFQREAVLRISVKVVGLASTIPAALILRSYWALVLGMTAMSIFNVVLSYAMRPYRPTLTLAATRSIMNFSGWLMFNNVVFFVRAQIHTIFIGRLLGPKELGTFNMAYEIAMMTSTELIAPVNRAVYPGYAKLSNDKSAFRTTFLDVFSLIMIISLPAAFGTAAVADDLAPLLLGDAWLATIPLIKLLAIFGALSTLNSNMMFVIHALGKPRLATRIAIWDAVLIAPILYLAITHYGVIGAAWSMAASYALVSTPLWWRTIGQELGLPMTALLSRLWRPLLAGTFMYGFVTLLQTNALSSLSRPLAIAIAVAAGVTLYFGMLGLLWRLNGLSRGGESILVDFIRQRIERALSQRRQR